MENTAPVFIPWKDRINDKCQQPPIYSPWVLKKEMSDSYNFLNGGLRRHKPDYRPHTDDYTSS